MSDLKHTIRTKNRKQTEISNYTKDKAIKLFCTECLGYGEETPKNCTDLLCPLFPHRGICRAGYHSEKSQKKPIDPIKSLRMKTLMNKRWNQLKNNNNKPL